MSNPIVDLLNICTFSRHGWAARCCLLCGAQSAHGAICPGCDADLPRLRGALCTRCGLPIPTPDATTCGACLAAPPQFDRLAAPLAYLFPVDALVRALKYAGRLAIARLLATAMMPLLDEPIDIIVPMPLSESRLRERGFNQAHEIAHHLGRARRLNVTPFLCRRVIDAPPQASLPWRQRARNVRRAFVCDADLTGLRVAVVDDVVTTGATMNEVCRVLRRAGAETVSAWSAARTLPPPGPFFGHTAT